MTPDPPAYNSSLATNSDPQLPPTFKIGSAFTLPLVSISDVYEYLLVLRAFYKIKQNVLEASWAGSLDPAPYDQTKWAIFLACGKHRFELWVDEFLNVPAREDGKTVPLSSEEVPPLDVRTYLTRHSGAEF